MKDQAVSNNLPVSEHIGALLCDIAYGWTPTPLMLGRVEQLFYNDIDLSKHAAIVRIENHKLNVTFSARSPDGRSEIPMPLSLRATLKGTIMGGIRFFGDLICHLSRGANASKELGAHDAVSIQTEIWNIFDGEVPSIWIGRIEGTVDSILSGNLIVERRQPNMPRSGATYHFFLSGAYAYYLVRYGEGDSTVWHLVIDTQGTGAPDMKVLGCDFLALQFVLGRQLQMPELIGVASDRRTVACMRGCDSRRNLEEHAYPPVPLGRTNDGLADESWAAVFFERISSAWRSRPASHSSFWMALEMYLDSMRNHLDSDYMRLQVALEAFAYWLLVEKDEDEPVDVKDKGSWQTWVQENAGAIRGHAAPGREEALFSKVKSVYRRSSGAVVPNAFSDYTLSLTKEMKKELLGRNIVVHKGLMAPDGYNVERDLKRVALVRTMLVGLIAKAVNYGGAINGWELGEMGYPLEPSAWWTIDDKDRCLAKKTYVAEEIISNGSSR